MKVLLVHNYYRSSSPSGEDAVYEHEAELLRNRGVEVVRYIRRNDEITNPLQAIFDAVWSKKTYREVSALIKKEKPDVTHFHNIWYLISPSAYYACKDSGVPVVQTLHNFRMFCANGLLLRNGKTCEDCICKAPWRGVAYGCYRNSRLYSLPVAFTEMVHRRRGTWVNAVDAYIALTEFGKRKFVQCGLPAEKIFVKPNFLADPPSPNHKTSDYAIFVGRLSEEKGLNVLIDALRILSSSNQPIPTSSRPHISSFSCKIVGDGPLMKQAKGERQSAKGTSPKAQGEGQKVKNNIGANFEFTGRKSHAECMELLSKARFMIMPSVCYENFPMAIREAFACGKPVIASNLGAMAAIVEHEETGLLFEPGNAEDLANAIKRLWEDETLCLEMGRNARAEFDAKYTADRNFDMLMNIYRSVLDNATKGK